MKLKHNLKTVEELNIKEEDTVLYQGILHRVIFATGYWVNLAPMPFVMVHADEVEKQETII